MDVVFLVAHRRGAEARGEQLFLPCVFGRVCLVKENPYGIPVVVECGIFDERLLGP